MNSNQLCRTPGDIQVRWIVSIPRQPFGPLVMKLPTKGTLPAAPDAAGVALAIIPPVAFAHSVESLFGTTGDLAPVIFWPAAVRAVEAHPSLPGGELSIAPAALAEAGRSAPVHFRRNRKISPFFCPINHVVGPVNTVRYEREHQEGCLLNTTVCDCLQAECANANLRNPRENRPTFHLQED